MMVTILIIFTAFAEGFSVLLVIPLLEGLGQETQTVTNNSRFLQFVNGLFTDVPDDQLLQTVALLFVGMTVLRAAISMVAATLQAWLQFRLDRELREEVFLQILHVSYEDLNQRRDSDWQLILNSETGRASSAVFGVVTMASSFFNMLVYIGVLVAVSWQMTLVAGILLGVVFAALTSLVRLAEKIGKRRLEAALKVQYGTVETLNAKRIIRIMHQQAYEQKRYFKALRNMQTTLVYLKVVNQASRELVEVLVIGLLALLLLLGGFVLDVDQKALIPIISTFILILYRMLPHVLSLNTQRTSISSDFASISSVVGVLNTRDKHYVQDGHLPFTGLHDCILFDDLSFQYVNRDGPALNNISFEIRRGETVALVGSSGAGKSTIADMLTRLYDPQQGRILVDGVDLRDLRLADWRQRIGVVSQDTFVFNDTIAFNISYGAPHVTQEDIEQAARYANAHDFIMELPQGYQTRVGDRGVLLSGGQRQRIAIARAILRDPEILILDEATAALDTKNERLIQAALDNLSANRTVLVIAHRLSTIINADKIVVMDKSRIVEMGAHDELLARRGYYADLYHAQFEQPEITAELP
jgi:subfamily B ATP-binding cassette protein MsbA